MLQLSLLGGRPLRQILFRSLLLVTIAVFSCVQGVVAQSTATALASLPEADAVIYLSPQRILNEAAPRVVPAAELAKMRASLADLKSQAGVDIASLEYVVVAVRFNKPSSNLSFVAPDVLIVLGGDFSSDSLLTLGQLYLQDNARVEQYGSKSMTVMKIDPLVAEAQNNPMLKPYAEIGAFPLTANSLAIGNLAYLKSAVDAADGNGRIDTMTIQSLLRDPNALVAASGAPLASFAKSFGLMGLENSPREARFDTRFGNFYAAITMSGANFHFRGAMNVDNPDTAKIIYGLISGLMQQGIDAVPDKDAQTILKTLKMEAKESEIVWQADIPEKMVADVLKPAPPEKPTTVPAKKAPAKRPVKKKRSP